jgi:hypothetical protein
LFNIPEELSEQIVAPQPFASSAKVIQGARHLLEFQGHILPSELNLRLLPIQFGGAVFSKMEQRFRSSTFRERTAIMRATYQFRCYLQRPTIVCGDNINLTKTWNDIDELVISTGQLSEFQYFTSQVDAIHHVSRDDPMVDLVDDLARRIYASTEPGNAENFKAVRPTTQVNEEEAPIPRRNPLRHVRDRRIQKMPPAFYHRRIRRHVGDDNSPRAASDLTSPRANRSVSNDREDSSEVDAPSSTPDLSDATSLQAERLPLRFTFFPRLPISYTDLNYEEAIYSQKAQDGIYIRGIETLSGINFVVYRTTEKLPNVPVGSLVISDNIADLLYSNIHRLGHPQREGILRYLRSARLYMPSFNRIANEFSCDQCILVKQGYTPPRTQQIHATYAFQTLTVDFMAIPVSYRSRKYAAILVCRDRYSGFVDLFPTSDISSRSACAALMAFGQKYQFPARILCDNGPAFASSFFLQWTAAHAIDVLYTPIYSPQSNGSCERTVRTLHESISCQLLATPVPPLSLMLGRAAWTINFCFAAVNDSSITPAQVVYRYSAHTPFIHFVTGVLQHQPASNGDLDVGDLVLLRLPNPPKWGSRYYDKHFRISARPGNHLYRLETLAGTPLRYTYRRAVLAPIPSDKTRPIAREAGGN